VNKFIGVILIEKPMGKIEKTILLILTGMIGTLAVYVAVRFWSIDVTYIVPGWHTTIYPSEIIWPILAVIILVISLVAYIVLRGVFRILTTLWTKLRS
jgi:hypothetical protein